VRLLECSGVFRAFESECSRFRPFNLWRACGGVACATVGVWLRPEHFLDMEGVRGSIPLPPTININGLDFVSSNRARVSPMKRY
jgi:hypothetical protein